MAKRLTETVFEEAFDPERVCDSTEIVETNLQGEFVRVGGDLAYYNGRYSDALEMYLKAKHNLKFVAAVSRKRLREEAQAKGTKLTEGALEDLVEVDPAMVACREELIAAEVLKSRVGGIIEAVVTKRDMLVSLGAHVREEMRGQPSISSEERIRERERKADV